MFVFNNNKYDYLKETDYTNENQALDFIELNRLRNDGVDVSLITNDKDNVDNATVDKATIKSSGQTTLF